MKKIPLFILSIGLLLSSCVTSKPGIRISHSFIDSPQQEVHFKALNSVYLLIDKSRSGGNGESMAATLADGMKNIHGGLLAYRVVSNVKKADPYLKKINPTAILTLEIESPICNNEIRNEKKNVKQYRFSSCHLSIKLCETWHLKNRY